MYALLSSAQIIAIFGTSVENAASDCELVLLIVIVSPADQNIGGQMPWPHATVIKRLGAVGVWPRAKSALSRGTMAALAPRRRRSARREYFSDLI